MPGISRSPRSSSRPNSWGWFDAMSAAFRYARIFIGFSSWISRRSAISRRMRAIAALSNPQPFGVDVVIEQPRAAGGQRRFDRRPALGRTVAEEAATAARAAHFGRSRARARGSGDQIVDRRRRHTRGEPLAVVPLDGDVLADGGPVAARERRSQRHRRVADAFEAVEDLAIAVDVPLEDLPVVRSRVPRRAGVGEHDPALELVGVHVEADAADAV